MRRVFAILALLMALTFWAVAPSGAHTPQASADCHGLTISLTNYNARDDNNVTVSFGNTTIVDHQAFGESYNQTIPFPDSTIDNQWTVVVFTDADRGGSKGWSKRITGTSIGCPTPTPTPSKTVPPQPEPWTKTNSERSVDCDLGVAIVISEVIFHDFVWNPDTWAWDEVVTSSNSHTEQEPLTDKETAACQPISTPSPTPTSKPSATPSHRPTSLTPVAPHTTEPSPTSPTSTPPSPRSTPSPSASTPVSGGTVPLAETGSNAGQIVSIAGIISVLGALLLWASRRRKASE